MMPTSPSPALLALSGIRKAFNSRVVIPDLSLTLCQGEFVTLLGPSGCGKTTLLRLIAGLENPDQGILKLNGTDITSLPAEQRSVGTVFQNYALFPHMSVADNVGFSLRMQRRPAAEIRHRVTEMLTMVQLDDFAGYLPSQLSGGQQQRVAIARAIISHPALLLLDEPLSALDFPLRKQMQDQLKMLQKHLGITCILVTHDRQEALALSDRIVLMKEGRLLQDGSPRTLYQRPVNPFVAGFIGEVNQLNAEILYSLSADQALVSIHGYQRRVQCSFPVRAGARVLVLIRPEDLSVLPAGGEQSADGIAGSIHSTDYQGRVRETRIRLHTGETITACQWMNHDSSHLPISPGMPVMVSWPTDCALIFPS